MQPLAELAANVASLLKEKKHTIAVAESSAGGLISAPLVAVPGASAFYLGGGVIYTVTTANLVSDANTNLEILDTNGTTVLVSNNDCPGFTDGSSCLTWTAPRTDTFYIRVKHATDAGIYGSYSLQATNP